MGFEKLCVFCVQFRLAVERLTVSFITSTQSSVLKFVKSWLNLPKTATLELFHLDVLIQNFPFLPHQTYVLAVEWSVDPLIAELRHSVITNILQFRCLFHNL